MLPSTAQLLHQLVGPVVGCRRPSSPAWPSGCVEAANLDGVTKDADLQDESRSWF